MARKKKNRKNNSSSAESSEKDTTASSDELRALTRDETEERIGSLNGWSLDKRENRLVRDLRFDDFGAALAFLNQVGEIAEDMDHHPEIYNSYNLVSLALMTHDVDGISDRDFSFAERVNTLA